MSPIRYFLMIVSGSAFVSFCYYEWRYDNSVINFVVSLWDINFILGGISAGFLFMCGGALCLILFALFDMIRKK